MPQYQLIVMNTGYVETGSLGVVLFVYNKHQEDGSTPVFEGTPQEFVSSLATSLFTKWYWDTLYITRIRGTGNWPNCEIDWTKVNPEDFAAMIRILPRMTADSFGGEETPDWWPWFQWHVVHKIPLEQTVTIYEHAEQLLPLYVDLDQVILNANVEHSKHIKELYQAWLLKKKLAEGLTVYKEKLFQQVCKTY